MDSSKTSECFLYRLPNELLLHLLAPLPTPQLLPLTLVSHRIYALILRILHNRLVAVSSLDLHMLLLECYHPSAKLIEPPYFCAYLGTDGLSTYEEPDEHNVNLAGRLGEMRSMYSRFRPYRRELEVGGRKVKRRPGDIPGSRTFPGTVSDRFGGEIIKQMLNLDGHELFTQLCAVTNLVKLGPRNGIFTSFVEIEEGVIRVWRDWLREMNANNTSSQVIAADEPVEEIGKGKEPIQHLKDEKDRQSKYRQDLSDPRIQWLSPAKNTGLRFNVRERKLRRDAPILIRAEEDTPVSYEIEYDELLIRTPHLLLMLEKSMVQEDNTSGKAVVFGSFG